MSASRSAPISTAITAKASQRWSATRSVRGVLARSSVIAAASGSPYNILHFSLPDAAAIFELPEHLDSQHAAGEQRRVGFQQLVGPGHGDEQQRDEPRRA